MTGFSSTKNASVEFATSTQDTGDMYAADFNPRIGAVGGVGVGGLPSESAWVSFAVLGTGGAYTDAADCAYPGGGSRRRTCCP
jgi:hypothetical protein